VTSLTPDEQTQLWVFLILSLIADMVWLTTRGDDIRQTHGSSAEIASGKFTLACSIIILIAKVITPLILTCTVSGFHCNIEKQQLLFSVSQFFCVPFVYSYERAIRSGRFAPLEDEDDAGDNHVNRGAGSSSSPIVFVSRSREMGVTQQVALDDPDAPSSSRDFKRDTPDHF
jgi:hypothetical protein